MKNLTVFNMNCSDAGSFYFENIYDELSLESVKISEGTSGRTPAFFIQTEGI